MKFIDTYNAVLGAIVTVMTALFGTYWYVFAAFLALNVIDWLTGWAKSRMRKEECSHIGLKGILKKLGYWAIVATAFILSTVFVHMGRDILHVDLEFLHLLGWYTLACLLVNEIRSILENLVECGCAVPEVLVKGLKVTDKLLNAVEEKIDIENEKESE